MLKRFSNQQLEKLLLHTVGINSVLTEVLLPGQDDKPPFEADEPTEVNIDIFVVDPNDRGERPEKEDLNIDYLCAEWSGGKKKPDLRIFKAAVGYVAAFGKKPQKDETGECFLIDKVNGNLCILIGNGYVYLSYDGENDKLNLYPGGEYSRIEEAEK